MAKMKTVVKGLDALKNISVGQTVTARKSGTPARQVSDAMNQAMVEFQTAKIDLENAQARKLNAEMQMMDEAHELRLQECRNSGKLHSSVKLAGKTTSLTFTQKAQCLKMNLIDCEDKIRRIVGADDDFDQYFKIKGNFKIDEEALMALENADEVAAAIVKALGTNAHIITREAVIVPTDKFYNDKVFDPKTVRMAEQLVAEGLAVPHKASFK